MTAEAAQTTVPRRGARPRELVAAALLVAILLGVSGFLSWEVPRISSVRGTRTDFIMELVALRAFAQGQNPYSEGVSAQIESAIEGRTVSATAPGHDKNPYLYPLPQTLLFLPVITLPTEAAILLVRAVTVALYLAALTLLIWRFAGNTPLLVRAGLLLVGIFWWPFLAVILPLAQQAGTVFALLVFAVLAAEHGRWFGAGVAAYIALLKPADSAPMILVLAAWALTNAAGRWSFVRGFLAVGLPTAAVAFIARPTWLFDWLTQLVQWRGPGDFALVNPPATLAGVLGIPTAVVWGGVTVVALVWTLIVARYVRWFAALRAPDAPGAPYADALWWSMGLTGILTMLALPRIANYDMVVMLVAWFVAFHLASALPGRERLLAQVGLALLVVGVGILAYRDHALVEMPIFAFALLALLWLLRPRAPTMRTMPASVARQGESLAAPDVF